MTKWVSTFRPHEILDVARQSVVRSRIDSITIAMTVLSLALKRLALNYLAKLSLTGGREDRADDWETAAG